jgi:hypothetical protein
LDGLDLGVVMQSRISHSWDDMQVIVTAAKLPAADAPVWAAYKGSEVLAFKKDATNSISFSVQLPHTWLQGSNILFHLHIAYPIALTGDSVWQMTYSWANIGSDFPAETTPTKTTIASPNVIDRHQIASMATIAGAGKTLSSIILCSLSRLGNDVADTFNDYIYLVGLDFHIEHDSIGSLSELNK